MNPYDVLGVSRDATDAQITDAHRRLAQQFHPDQHPEASAAERAAWNQAMSSINEAYSALRDPNRRVEANAARAGSSAASSNATNGSDSASARRPFVGECDLCGSAPATPLSFQQQTAFLFGARMYTTQFEMCRQCGLAVGRSRQNRTLLTGWWGVISFFRNFAVIFSNARQLRRAGALARPARSELIVTPLPSPLPVGKSVFGRFGFWATAAVFAIAASGVAASSQHKTDDGNVGNYPSSSETWRVGACVAYSGSQVYPISCSQAHSGRINGTASSGAQCSTATDTYVPDGSFVWCITDE